jgi:hypothetical protein
MKIGDLVVLNNDDPPDHGVIVEFYENEIAFSYKQKVKYYYAKVFCPYTFRADTISVLTSDISVVNYEDR